MTKIAWCDETINPVVGCSKISAGCQNCYAENMARRLAAMGMEQYRHTIQPIMAADSINRIAWGGWDGSTYFVHSELQKPAKWRAPRSIFVGSMGDMFHESVLSEWLDAVMLMVHDNPQHTFIFLTKRPKRMQSYMASWYTLLQFPNLALGVTAEDQKAADERIPILLQIPAVIRFVSIEPMIGPVDFNNIKRFCNKGVTYHPLSGNGLVNCEGSGVYTDGPRLSGVILGGESGQLSRPLSPVWIRQVRDQCAAAGVPFMFKQWGNNVIHAGSVFGFFDNKGLPIIDGCVHSSLPWKTRKSCEP